MEDPLASNSRMINSSNYSNIYHKHKWIHLWINSLCLFFQYFLLGTSNPPNRQKSRFGVKKKRGRRLLVSLESVHGVHLKASQELGPRPQGIPSLNYGILKGEIYGTMEKMVINHDKAWWFWGCTDVPTSCRSFWKRETMGLPWFSTSTQYVGLPQRVISYWIPYEWAPQMKPYNTQPRFRLGIFDIRGKAFYRSNLLSNHVIVIIIYIYTYIF